MKTKTKNFIPYIGNGAYCYANATAMFLSFIKENIAPSTIEVLSGVGLGAFLNKENNLFFSNVSNTPDKGISKALDILGFVYREKVKEKEGSAPIRELKKDLKKSPAILGPLNMGYLKYNPGHQRHKGVDHYVLVYALDNEKVELHDPVGFPCVFLPVHQLKLAWKAKDIFYRRGFYRYWTLPRRTESPTEKEIYKRAIKFFKSTYQESVDKASKEKIVIGHKAIITTANRVKRKEILESEITHLAHFALPLGAKRALDFSSFFKQHDRKLAELKYKQAKLFGESHVLVTQKRWTLLRETLKHLAILEEKFRQHLLDI